MIAARLNVIVRDPDLLRRLFLELRNLLRARHRRLRRIIVLQHSIQRCERLDLRKREPRALQRDIAEIKPHRPWLRDLFDLVKIARGIRPIADAAAERGAGKEATRKSATICELMRRPIDGFGQAQVCDACLFERLYRSSQ